MTNLPTTRRGIVGLGSELVSDTSGTTVMEFGLISVVFVTMLIGMFDVGQTAYTQSILNGAVQEAARTSTLETGDTSAADARVLELVQNVAPSATLDDTVERRKSYYDFADVERAEKWNDDDSDGLCNNGENYTDENGNGMWDDDIGSTGNGGAGDVVIYTVKINYKPLFPIPFYDGSDATRSLTSVAVKKNQPYANQTGYGSASGTCS